jgi:hypothetical protein
MKTKLIASLALTALLCGLSHAATIGTAFNYQGFLRYGNLPVNANYGMRFSLYE